LNSVAFFRFNMSKKKITQLKPDSSNFNKHTEFGMHLLEKSMTKFGFVEAGVISEDGVIVSGNARQETAVNIGIEDVEIIKTDGKKAVYLQIEGLKSGTPEFHEMALALNAVPQKNIDFNFEVMADFPEIPFTDWGVQPEWTEEKAELQEEIILPVEMAHFLISVDINNVDRLLPIIQQIKDLQIAEIETNVN
jgi:hypothetical protein